ncbi:MAG TPA: hypothetical protein VJW93_11330 [Candidatus Acidoferrales bacterium]|nr:hypothetical protein [Candidatus Acidoferrales bacterium]
MTLDAKRLVRGHLTNESANLLIKDETHGIALAIGCDGFELYVASGFPLLDEPTRWCHANGVTYSCN